VTGEPGWDHHKPGGTLTATVRNIVFDCPDAYELAQFWSLVTGHPLLTRNGPQLLPSLFNHDQDGCVRSVAALAMLDTEVLLPGHGPVWRGSIGEAANRATP